MKRLFIALIRVVYFFIKEKVFRIKPKMLCQKYQRFQNLKF
jgi:hypothetical protein